MDSGSTPSRRVLITGSSRGIGRAIALALARAGFAITVHARSNAAAAQEVCAQIAASSGAMPELLMFDVADGEEAKKVLGKSVEERGAFYGVVLNAGIARDQPFPGLTCEDWDTVIRTNLDGFYHVLHPLVMPMIQLRQGGRIVVLSSLAGVVGNRGQVNYSAAKAGLIGAAKALSKELAKRKITVNCVAPGLIETDMIRELPLEEIISSIPMRRVGKAEEVAGLVSYLFSDLAEYLTGQVISINGGIA